MMSEIGTRKSWNKETPVYKGTLHVPIPCAIINNEIANSIRLGLKIKAPGAAGIVNQCLKDAPTYRRLVKCIFFRNT